MAVDEPNKIDFVAYDKTKTFVDLVISDHLDWRENEGEHLLILQDKLNTYLEFKEGGQLVERFPWAASLPVTIKIMAKYPLSPQAEKFLRLAKDPVEETGAALVFELVPQKTKSGRNRKAKGTRSAKD